MQDIPLKFWNRLQHGETVKDPETGRTYKPEMVMGPERRGLKVTYATDSRPCDNIRRAACGADLFICEGMYGEPGMEEKARGYKHMTMYEAAEMAKAADPAPKEMWFTHYSPSMLNPRQYLDEVKKIFPNVRCGKDGLQRELVYED